MGKSRKKKPRFVNVKVWYIDEKDFITEETINYQEIPVKERIEKLKIVYEDKFGYIYAERNGQLYVYNPNTPNLTIEYE